MRKLTGSMSNPGRSDEEKAIIDRIPKVERGESLLNWLTARCNLHSERARALMLVVRHMNGRLQEFGIEDKELARLFEAAKRIRRTNDPDDIQHEANQLNERETS